MIKTKPLYIPALRYPILTPAYDFLTAMLIPEKKIKTRLIQQAGILPHQNILDFGCGTLTLGLLINKLHPSTFVTALDVDPSILEISERKRRKVNAGIIIKQYDGKHLPFPDEHFDRVFSSFVFMHLSREHKIQSLQEIRRVLKKDGEMHIADWGKPSGWCTRMGFLPLQLWIGKKRANDNIQGLLPGIIRQSGFSCVQKTQHCDTFFGTVRMVRAIA